MEATTPSLAHEATSTEWIMKNATSTRMDYEKPTQSGEDSAELVRTEIQRLTRERPSTLTSPGPAGHSGIPEATVPGGAHRPNTRARNCSQRIIFTKLILLDYEKIGKVDRVSLFCGSRDSRKRAALTVLLDDQRRRFLIISRGRARPASSLTHPKQA
jgi:hypothetical protein